MNGLGLSFSDAYVFARNNGRPAFLLDFAQDNYSLSGVRYGTLADAGVTFSRGTNATMIDSTGKLTYAPSNQFTNSESFAVASSWSRNTLIAVNSNVIAAPDGTITADKIAEDGTTNGHYLGQTFSSIASVSYTCSIYVKAAERQYVQIILVGAVGSALTAGFDLSGSGSTVTSAGTTSVITSVGDGWYRCSITASATISTAGASIQFRIATSLSTTPANYLGDGVSGLYLWGAQIGAVTYETAPRTYNSTTPKNLLGYTEEFNNAVWTKTNSFVQTNLMFPSDATTGWAASPASCVAVTANAATSPDGTTNATKLATNDTASNGHTWYKTYTGAVSTTYCGSVYLKAGEYTRAQMAFDNSSFAVPTGALFDLAAGTVVATGGGSTATITSVGNGWYRCSVTATSVAIFGNYVVTLSPVPASVTTFNANYTPASTGLGVYVYGVQVVQGSTAGNYQQTISAAAPVQYPDPNSYLNADKIVVDTGTSTHLAQQSFSVTDKQIVTGSVYVKAAEYNFATLLLLTNFAANQIMYVNLSTGDILNVQGSPLSTTATAVGNGWWRISMSQITNAAGTSMLQVRPSNSSITSFISGDGTSGIYVWGAQVSDSASLDPYVYNPAAAPTSTAYYGPRFEYDPVTLAPLGLLIEEARTNLLLYSNQINNVIWIKNNSPTITTDDTASPDGTLNADLVTRTTTAATYLLQVVSKAASAITYTTTFYVKKSVGDYFALRLQGTFPARADVTFNIATGTISTTALATSTFTGASATITPTGNGWYRCSLTAISDTAISITSYFSFLSTNAAVDGTDTASNSAGYVWGAQLETGAFGTSYIPTVSASATRSADVATMVGNNFSNWYNQTTGTLAVSFEASANSGTTYISASNGSIVQNSVHIDNQSGNMRAAYRSGSTEVAAIVLGAIGTAGTTNKIATAYAVNDFAASRNGVLGTSDTSGALPVSLTQLNIGVDDRLSAIYYTSNHIKSIAYYNTRLPNSQLRAMTA